MYGHRYRRYSLHICSTANALSGVPIRMPIWSCSTRSSVLHPGLSDEQYPLRPSCARSGLRAQFDERDLLSDTALPITACRLVQEALHVYKVRSNMCRRTTARDTKELGDTVFLQRQQMHPSNQSFQYAFYICACRLVKCHYDHVPFPSFVCPTR